MIPEPQNLGELTTNLDEAAELLQSIRARTPARIFIGRSGPSYRTSTQHQLRQDHAAALDAVHAELDLLNDFGREFVERWQLFEVRSRAKDKAEFLIRPDLGRRLDESARKKVNNHCSPKADFQIIIGDGLSAAAVAIQVPKLLPLLEQHAKQLSWSFGQPFFIRYCRVGILNDIGEWLDPKVVVLLIGERPGLATAVSLSAYLAFRPRGGHSDARRNLISNIHQRGILPDLAAKRIVDLAAKMRHVKASGVEIKEDLSKPSSGMISDGVGE
jgi:ethanolamine ammonia-lyase small subunit